MLQSRVRLGLCIALLATSSSVAQGQRRSFAADLGVAGGSGRGGDYVNRDLVGLRLAASAPYAPRALGGFADISRQTLSHVLGTPMSCSAGPPIHCTTGFPQLVGWTGIVGLFIRDGSLIEFRAGAGAARYAVKDALNSHLGAFSGIADAAVYPPPYLGVAVAIQEVVLNEYSGDKLSVLPITIGLRVR